MIVERETAGENSKHQTSSCACVLLPGVLIGCKKMI